MKLNSFEEICKLDSELADLFLRPEMAVNWIYAMEKGIKEWIGKYNKQHWEVVRFVSERRGILGKLKKDRKTIYLTRQDFAKVLLKFCPEAIDKDDSISTLKSSMDHFKYKDDLRIFDILNSGRVVLRLCKEVESILDNMPLPDSRESESKPSLEDILWNYLRQMVDEQADRYPRSELCVRPQYEQLKSKPAFSIETFYSEQFLKQHEPSQITVFEFVYAELDDNKLNELYVKYRNFNNVKVFIVSSFGLHREIRAKAKDLLFGYVLINPNTEITSENFILPRSIEDYTKRQHDLEVLTGEKPMTTPMLIFDSCMETNTLPEVLHKYDVVVKKHYIFDIPSLSDYYIEKAANELTKKDVIERINLYYLFEEPNLDLSLDPFAYAKSVGLAYEMKAMGDSL